MSHFFKLRSAFLAGSILIMHDIIESFQNFWQNLGVYQCWERIICEVVKEACILIRCRNDLPL
eukprot:UN03028